MTSWIIVSVKSASAVTCAKPGCPTFVPAVDADGMDVAPVTDKEAVPACPSNEATMTAVPGATPVARPVLMVATDAGVDVHKTEAVRS